MKSLQLIIGGALIAVSACASAESFKFNKAYDTGATVPNVANLDYFPPQPQRDQGSYFGIFPMNIPPTSFLNAIAVDIDGTAVDYGAGLTIPRVEGGVSSVTLLDGGGPDASFDFTIKLGGGSNTLTSGEGAIFFLDLPYKALNRFAVELTNGSTSSWFVPSAQSMSVSAVPEPGTAGLLAGGLLVLMIGARARTASQSPTRQLTMA